MFLCLEIRLQNYPVQSAGCRTLDLLLLICLQEYSRILPEVLPTGAVVEEQELKGNRLHFIRLSGRGPYTGWVDVKDGRTELLFKVEASVEGCCTIVVACGCMW